MRLGEGNTRLPEPCVHGEEDRVLVLRQKLGPCCVSIRNPLVHGVQATKGGRWTVVDEFQETGEGKKNNTGKHKITCNSLRRKTDRERNTLNENERFLSELHANKVVIVALFAIEYSGFLL